jgi:hypothetical protein
VGYIEDVQALDLADDVKQQLIQAHEAEVDPLKETNRTLSAQAKKDSVEAEIGVLGKMGFEDAPGLLKFVRRVFLSSDAEEPGAVLLSDNELHLSGDAASGATGREEISVAGAIRKFIELMPRDDEGKLKIQLADQVTGDDDHGRPGSGEPTEEEQATERKERTNRLAGRTIDRDTVRSKRYRTASVSGGGE